MPTPPANGSSKPVKTQIVHIQAERTMLSDGTLIFKPLHIGESSQKVTTLQAAELTGLSPRQIQHLCDTGFYKTARQKTNRPKSHWMIDRREVMERRE